jgi:hypothetical protein
MTSHYFFHEQQYLLGDHRLPEEALKQCIIGHARILVYVKDRIVDALCPPSVLPSKACSSRKCDINSWQTVKNLPIWSTEESVTFRLFDCSEIQAPEYTCPRCRTGVTKLTEKVPSEFWSTLPIFFRIAGLGIFER